MVAANTNANFSSQSQHYHVKMSCNNKFYHPQLSLTRIRNFNHYQYFQHSWCFLSNMFLKLAHISQLDWKCFTFLPCRLQLMPMDHWPVSQISNLIFDIRQIGGCNVLNCYICIKIIFKCQHNIITQGLNIPSHIFSWFSKY